MESDLTLKRLVDMFEEAEQASTAANALASRCRKYYTGDQLTEEEKAELQARGQPAVVANLIRKEVNWMRGYEIQSKTDPRAFPRNPSDDELAEAATDALRFVADATRYSRARSKVWEGLIIEGIAGVEVIHKMKPPMREPKIVVNKYPYDRLFFDPHSTEDDFSDARYKGAVIWSDAAEIKEQYPDKGDIIEASLKTDGVLDTTFEDKPAHRIWADSKRKRVRVVMIYYRSKGVWKWSKYVRSGILEGGESPYQDEDGESVCPLIMRSMYVSDDNSRHGVVKDYLDPQDEVNKRRSKLLHQLNSRQTWGVAGAVASVAKMKRELAKPNGHVEITQEAADNARETGVAPFNIIQNGDQAAGQMQLLQESKASIEVMGANSALMGQGSASSGRQVLAEQQGGLVEIAPIYGQLLAFDQDVYEQMWQRVRQLWTVEKWVRVTDDEKKTRFVGLNQPVTLQDELSELRQQEVAAIAQRLGLFPGDPRLGQVVRVKNEVSSMHVDIEIGDAPDTMTLQQETFEQLVNLATSMPNAIPPDILVEAAPNLDRDIKDKLIERLEAQMQQQGQAGAAQHELEARKAQAEVASKEASAMEDMANAQKLQAETYSPALPAAVG